MTLYFLCFKLFISLVNSKNTNTESLNNKTYKKTKKYKKNLIKKLF